MIDIRKQIAVVEESKGHWPAWFYGPNGEAEIFEGAADVPADWRDSPAAFGAKTAAEISAEIDAAADIRVAEDAAKRGPGRPRRVAD